MEIALDVGVMWQVILSLFVVYLVTALARPAVAGVCCGGLRIYARARARATLRRADTREFEAKAVVAEAEAVVAAERLRLRLGGS
jgi:hypothetical protein